MHPLAEGVTVVVTPSARWVGLAIRRGACLDQLVDELARRDSRRLADLSGPAPPANRHDRAYDSRSKRQQAAEDSDI